MFLALRYEKIRISDQVQQLNLLSRCREISLETIHRHSDLCCALIANIKQVSSRLNINNYGFMARN